MTDIIILILLSLLLVGILSIRWILKRIKKWWL